MKTVFSSHWEVAHVWAQRTQSHGRAGNILFENDRIYSYGYHYEIARFEKNHVVINDKGYSFSTAKHIGIVRSAVSHYEQFLASEINTSLILSDLQSRYKKIQKSRKPYKYWVYGENPLQRFEEYLNRFELSEREKKISGNKENLSEIKKIVKKLDLFVSNPEIKKVVSNNIKKEQEEKRRKEREQEEKRNQAVEEFKKFKIDSLPYYYNLGNVALIRFNPETKNVETSKGIKIDGKKALVLFQLIEAGRDVKGYKIDSYTVISINGILKVGCHEIGKEDVFKVGNELKTFYS